MDTTYFGRSFGVMVFRDATTGLVLYRNYVKHETNLLYAGGLSFLRTQGVEVRAVVCDGRRGLMQLCAEIPVQMCQFHQVAIITRYLTRKPKLPAAVELPSTSALTIVRPLTFSRRFLTSHSRPSMNRVGLGRVGSTRDARATNWRGQE